jgi:hypothetical protein
VLFVTTRLGAALALVVSIAALAVSVAAYTATVRDESTKPGRLVSTRVNSDYLGEPLLFPVDDFYIGYDSRFEFRAFYVFPPGYYGHDRGCKVVWDNRAVVDTASGQQGPGLYVEPCGGARFNKDGQLVEGPADRGLDFFRTEPGVDGVIVDTRRLLCGAPLSDATSATLTATATPTAALPAVTPTPTPPGIPPVPAESPSATATVTVSLTATPGGDSPTATATPAPCVRVTSESKQR